MNQQLGLIPMGRFSNFANFWESSDSVNSYLWLELTDKPEAMHIATAYGALKKQGSRGTETDSTTPSGDQDFLYSFDITVRIGSTPT